MEYRHIQCACVEEAQVGEVIWMRVLEEASRNSISNLRVELLIQRRRIP